MAGSQTSDVDDAVEKSKHQSAVQWDKRLHHKEPCNRVPSLVEYSSDSANAETEEHEISSALVDPK